VAFATLALAVAPFWLMTEGLSTGKTTLPLRYQPSIPVLRERNPRLFWVCISSEGIVGAGLVVVSVLNFREANKR
jgi:hypothetical protein